MYWEVPVSVIVRDKFHMNMCLSGNAIQYSFLGRTAASIRLNTTFCLRMGTEVVPETLYSNELMRLCT